MKFKHRLKNTLTLVLFCMMGQSYSQAPDLGTAADFVIFSTVGAVTKTGVGFAHLTGNVGTNSGSSTGFGNVNGGMHDGDPESALCTADLLLAYAELDAAIPTIFPGLLLGGGITFTPGVYESPGASTLDGELILDGLGDPDALFIIQIDGAFSTSANSKVNLINEAQACNVFWKIEGEVNMATGTTMRGTIVANNAAINMAIGDTLEGRALAIAGAISLDAILAYTPIGCGSPVLDGPLAPDLVSAECYTLFTTIGPVTNAGITNVVGDVGTDDGLTTGFDPLLVVGTIHPIPDGSTAACGVDVLSAYLYLNGVTEDIELLYPPQFGNNLVLTPHTYVLNGAVTFTDTLYLDAQDNPDAVFLIKIYGALTTSVNSKVILINGTQSKNVYWMVDGAVGINDNSIFRGTIICNNGAMSLTTGVYLDGRALTTTGALNTSAITAIMPPGCGGFSEPIIITEPLDVTVCVGDSISLIVEATGTGLTYQWRKGDVDLVDGGSITGATTDTLTINPVSPLDAGSDYNVIVSGIYLPNDTSEYVSIIVDVPADITSEPIDQTVCEGDSVSFTVVSSGSGLTYQWRKGDIDLVDGGSISGATTDTLTINPADPLDAAANYNVFVTSTCAPADTSIFVSLTIDTAPVITIEPIDQTVCEGDSVSFTVVSSGSGLTYQWRKGDIDLVDGGSISGATTDTLTINPADPLDAAANYNVFVTGTCAPSDTSVLVQLTIDIAPVITSEPIDQTVCEGDSVSFTVVSSGLGLTYQWRKGDVDLVDGGSISGATTAVLTINPVDPTDAAINYNVIIVGTCEPADTSIFVELTIDAAPLITSEPTDQTVCAGESASFSVIATGTALTYQWRKGLINLIDGGAISGATSATLTINPVVVSDAATNYNVVISGTCSSPAISINVALIQNNPIIEIEPLDQTVCIGDSVVFSITASGMSLTYQWRLGITDLVDGGNISGVTTNSLVIYPATSFNAGSDYSVVVSGACAPTDTSVQVELLVNDCDTLDFFIPEAFSPNDDLINDLFIIRGIEYYPENSIVIFNRWGNMVFTASPYQNSWDGQATEGLIIGGSELPVGTYFYILDLGDGSEIIKGTIYLNK